MGFPAEQIIYVDSQMFLRADGFVMDKNWCVVVCGLPQTEGPAKSMFAASPSFYLVHFVFSYNATGVYVLCLVLLLCPFTHPVININVFVLHFIDISSNLKQVFMRRFWQVCAVENPMIKYWGFSFYSLLLYVTRIILRPGGQYCMHDFLPPPPK